MKTDEELRAEAKTEEWSFKSEDKYELLGRGQVYVVANPINCYNFDWLIGKKVKIDENPFKVLGVESKATHHKVRGSHIGLLVGMLK